MDVKELPSQTQPGILSNRMIRSELKTAMDAISRLQDKMKGEEKDVEAWVQSKITKAADYLQAAANYIDSGESEVK